MAKRLLVLDPEAKFSSIASVALKSAGWDTSTAKTFGEARELVIAIAPDAMICPNTVEGKDEIAIVKDIRAQRNGSALPIILLGAKSHFGPNTYLTPSPLSASALSILITKIESRREDMGMQVENFDQAFDSIMQDKPSTQADQKVLKLGAGARHAESRDEKLPEEKKSVEPQAPPAEKPVPQMPEPLSAPETWVIKKPASAATSEPVLRLEESWIVTSKDFTPELETYRIEGKKPPATPPKFGLVKAEAEKEEAAPVAAAAAVASVASVAAAVEAPKPAAVEKPSSAGELKSFFGKVDESSLEEGGVEELHLEEPEAPAVEASRPLPLEASAPAEEADMETDLSESLEESFEFEEFEAVRSAPPPPEAVEEEIPSPEAETPEFEPVTLESEAVLEEEAPSIGDLEKIFQEMYPAAGKKGESAQGEEGFDEARALELLDSHLESSFGTAKASPAAAVEPLKEESFAGEEEELALEEQVQELQEAAGETVEEEAIAPLPSAAPETEATAAEIGNIEEKAVEEDLEFLFETAPEEETAEATEPVSPDVEAAEAVEDDVEMLPAVLSPAERIELESYFKDLETKAPEAEPRQVETGLVEEQAAGEPVEIQEERFISISEEPEEAFELESPAAATLYAEPKPAESVSLESAEEPFGDLELETPLAALSAKAAPEPAEEFGMIEFAEEASSGELLAEETPAVEFFAEEEVKEEMPLSAAGGEQKSASDDFFDFGSIEEELSGGEAEAAVEEAPSATAPVLLEEFEFSSVEEELSVEPSGIAESLLAQAAEAAELPLTDQSFDFAAAETEVKVPAEVLSPSAVFADDFDFETAEEETVLPVAESFALEAEAPEPAVPGDGHPPETHELDFDELDGVLGELEEFTPSLDVRGGFSFEPVEVLGAVETDGAVEPWKKAAALAAEAASKSIADSGLASSLSPVQLSEIIKKAVEKAVEESMGGASGK